MNWVNLLKMDFSRTLGKGFRIDLGSISIAKTRPERLIDDRQGFSNIEADNLPFSLSVAGLSFSRGASCLFAGLRNMNEDYLPRPSPRSLQTVRVAFSRRSRRITRLPIIRYHRSASITRMRKSVGEYRRHYTTAEATTDLQQTIFYFVFAPYRTDCSESLH